MIGGSDMYVVQDHRYHTSMHMECAFEFCSNDLGAMNRPLGFRIYHLVTTAILENFIAATLSIKKLKPK